MKNLENISLIIPFYDEIHGLGRTLEAIFSMKILPAEIIIINTWRLALDSDNLTHAYSTASGVKIRVLSFFGAYPGAARNFGIENSSYSIVAFLDSSIIPEETWLHDLLCCQQLSDAAIVFGSCKFSSNHPFGLLVCALSYGVTTRKKILPSSIAAKTAIGNRPFRTDLRAGEDKVFFDMVDAIPLDVSECPHALVQYNDFPRSPIAAAKKWYYYEIDATNAGVISPFKYVLYFYLLMIFSFFIFWSSVYGLLMLVLYFFIRSIVDPCRRSRWRKWWNSPWQLIAVMPTAVLLDVSSLIGFVKASTKKLLKI